MTALKLNEQAKPFTLPGVDDRTHALSDYKDKEAVVVIFRSSAVTTAPT